MFKGIYLKFGDLSIWFWINVF